jgi:hypothetical protein
MPKKKKTDGGMKALKKAADNKEKEKSGEAKPFVKIARGAKTKGAGAVRTAKADEERGGVMCKEWQRIPSQLAQEYCQREKRPKPTYSKASGKNFRMQCTFPDAKKVERNLEFVPKESFETMTLAKENAALLALFHVTPTISYHTKLPEPYKTIWLSLQGVTATAGGGAMTAKEKKEAKAAKMQLKIQEQKWKKEAALKASEDAKNGITPGNAPAVPAPAPASSPAPAPSPAAVDEDAPKTKVKTRKGGGGSGGGGGGAKTQAALEKECASDEFVLDAKSKCLSFKQKKVRHVSSAATTAALG